MSLRLQRYEKKRTQQTFFLIIDNETPLGSHLTMVYFAAVNNIEEINNEIKGGSINYSSFGFRISS